MRSNSLPNILAHASWRSCAALAGLRRSRDNAPGPRRHHERSTSASRIASSMECVTRMAVVPLVSTSSGKLLLQYEPGLRVERAERLVEKQHIWLASPARAQARRAAACRPESCADIWFSKPEKVDLRRSPSRARASPLGERHAGKLQDRTPRSRSRCSQGNRLKACHTVDIGGGAGCRRRLRFDKAQLSARRIQEAARDLQERALAAAARSDERCDLAGLEPATARQPARSSALRTWRRIGQVQRRRTRWRRDTADIIRAQRERIGGLQHALVASVAGDRSNSLSLRDGAVDQLHGLEQELELGHAPSRCWACRCRSNQVQRGAASSISARRNLGRIRDDLDDLGVLRGRCFVEQPRRRGCAPWRSGVAAGLVLLQMKSDDITQQASWAFGSISEPAPMILPTLLRLGEDRRAAHGMLAASAWPTPIELDHVGIGHASRPVQVGARIEARFLRSAAEQVLIDAARRLDRERSCP